MFGDLLLRPSTVTSYLSGVKFMLRIANVDTRFMGLNPAFFSTHSLRVAGASALAAAGVPNYVPSLHAYNDAMTAMCNITTLTVSDLRRTTPAV